MSKKTATVAARSVCIYIKRCTNILTHVRASRKVRAEGMGHTLYMYLYGYLGERENGIQTLPKEIAL